jgi:hypothetical protein
MISEKLVLSVQMFLLSVYFSCWYGCILPEFAETEAFNYLHIGLSGAILLIVAAIVIFWDKNWGIVIRSVVLFINIIILLSLMISLFPTYLFFILSILAALFQGTMVGLTIKRSIKYALLNQNVPFLVLGSVGILIAQYLPYKLIANNASASVQSDAYRSNVTLLSIMTLILTIFGILDVISKSANDRDFEKKEIAVTFSQMVRYTAMTNAAIVVLIEIIFCFWSVVLLNSSQSLINSLTFPISVFMVFIFSVLFKKVGHKMTSTGWLFTLSVIMTVSLGLFYTFDFTPVFILGFGFSMAYLLYINNYIFKITANTGNLAGLLIIGSGAMIIAGLFIQNHIEFIKSINIPKDVLTLSARQALVKEMASFAAVSVILSGYLFLKRRSIFVSQYGST